MVLLRLPSAGVAIEDRIAVVCEDSQHMLSSSTGNACMPTCGPIPEQTCRGGSDPKFQPESTIVIGACIWFPSMHDNDSGKNNDGEDEDDRDEEKEIKVESVGKGRRERRRMSGEQGCGTEGDGRKEELACPGVASYGQASRWLTWRQAQC